jgi:hypothetical protein
MQGWLSILIMIALGAGFALISVVLSSVLGPSKPTPEKSAPYECGMPAVGDARERQSVKFYLVAMDLPAVRHRGRLPLPVGDGAARSRLNGFIGAAVHGPAAGRLRLRLAQGRARLGF